MIPSVLVWRPTLFAWAVASTKVVVRCPQKLCDVGYRKAVVGCGLWENSKPFGLRVVASEKIVVSRPSSTQYIFILSPSSAGFAGWPLPYKPKSYDAPHRERPRGYERPVLRGYSDWCAHWVNFGGQGPSQDGIGGDCDGPTWSISNHAMKFVLPQKSASTKK